LWGHELANSGRFPPPVSWRPLTGSHAGFFDSPGSFRPLQGPLQGIATA
jgi:hypothetical protein